MIDCVDHFVQAWDLWTKGRPPAVPAVMELEEAFKGAVWTPKHLTFKSPDPYASYWQASHAHGVLESGA